MRLTSITKNWELAQVFADRHSRSYLCKAVLGMTLFYFFLDVLILFATFNHFEKLTILGHQKLCSTDWPGATIKYLTAFFCLDSTIDRKKIENNIFLLNVARFSETLYDKTWVVFPLVMTTNLYLDRDIVYYL